MTDTGVTKLTCAEADFVASACEVTVTVTTAGLGAIAGAVYRPAAVMFPQLEPVQPLPETLHDTDVFELPVTWSENFREAEGATLAEVGEMVTVTTGTIVTVALADLVGSATDVAVTEKNGGFGGTAGAVNSPEGLTVPHVSPAQPIPVIVHVTAVLEEPVTVALNCFCALTPTWALVGDMEIATTLPEVIVTVADPDLVGSESKVAVTVTIGGFGGVEGAVYSPLALMLPQADPLHPVPAMLQITRGLELPLTAAVNCNWAPGFTWAEGGDTLTATAATSATAAEAEAEGSATAVAFTATLGGAGKVAGAV
ncbi:MAG: hypothetical protein WCA27_14435 [Candidatus Sulfotelmatobacter sp.]